MKRCTSCGQELTRPNDHTCGHITITRDRLRTLEEAEAKLRVLGGSDAA